MDLARTPRIGQEATVGTFPTKLLEHLGYEGHLGSLAGGATFPPQFAVFRAILQTGVCVCDDNEILVLVQGDKSVENPKNPEPRLTSEAIAAFQMNNLVRQRDLILPSLKR